MKHLLAIFLGFALYACATLEAYADPTPQVYVNPTLPDSGDNDPSLLGKILLRLGPTATAAAGTQRNVTITLYSAPTSTTVPAGSHGLIIMTSSDFVGTIQGAPYTGNGTAFQDAYQSWPLQGSDYLGPILITCTVGSYKVSDQR